MVKKKAETKKLTKKPKVDLAFDSEEKVSMNKKIEMLEKKVEEAIKLANESNELCKKLLKKFEVRSGVKGGKQKRLSKLKLTADKKVVLDFLQKKSWDLRKSNSNIADIRFEDDPPRVVITAVNEDEEFNLEHNGLAIEVEVEKATNAIMTDDEMKNLSINETPPNLTHVKKTKAFEAFQKRHKMVKTQ